MPTQCASMLQILHGLHGSICMCTYDIGAGTNKCSICVPAVHHRVTQVYTTSQSRVVLAETFFKALGVGGYKYGGEYRLGGEAVTAHPRYDPDTGRILQLIWRSASRDLLLLSCMTA